MTRVEGNIPDDSEPSLFINGILVFFRLPFATLILTWLIYCHVAPCFQFEFIHEGVLGIFSYSFLRKQK